MRMHKLSSRAMRKIISNFEIIFASMSFLLLLMVVIFRNSMALTSKVLVYIQQHTDNVALFDQISKILGWIGDNSQWTGEGAQWLWVWFVMLGISEAERVNENLKVDYFLEKISLVRIKLFVKFVLDLVFLSANVFLFFLSFQEIARSSGSTPTTLPMSNAWLYGSMTVGLFFLSIRITIRIVRNMKSISLINSKK